MSKDRLLQVLKTTGGWVFVVFCLLLALGAGACVVACFWSLLPFSHCPSSRFVAYGTSCLALRTYLQFLKETMPDGTS